jgi:hypothetical protein
MLQLLYHKNSAKNTIFSIFFKFKCSKMINKSHNDTILLRITPRFEHKLFVCLKIMWELNVTK